MSVRVIAGIAKGRRLRVPLGAAVRPTADRARETLFNVVAGRVPGARILDVFAGCGAVGIEALSRGAATATFVERDRATVKVLVENLQACRLDAAAEVIADGWQAGLRRVGGAAAVFNIVFFDPPYDWVDAHRCLDKVAQHALLAVGGVVIIEHRADTPPAAATGWNMRRKIDVGDCGFSMYTPCSEEAESSLSDR